MKNTFEVRSNVYRQEGYNLIKELYEDNNKIYDEIEKDGYYFKVNLKNWKDGYRPNIVDKRNPYSIENIRSFIIKNNISSVLLSDVYENNKSKLLLKCKCGLEYYTSWTHFYNGWNWNCKHCSLIKSNPNRLDINFVKDKIIKAGFTPLFKDYTNSLQKLKIMTKDGYILETLFHNIDKINGKDIVSSYNSYSIQNIKKFINDNGWSCELLSDTYVNKNKKLKFKCSCGEIFYTTWNSFRNQHVYRCRKCSHKQSFYEFKTEEWLKDNNFKYEKEVKFENCKYKRMLSFDFQVFLKDSSYCLIEVDGIFHYRVQYSEEKFKEQIKRDEIKNEFCKENKIPLLRINYWRFKKPYSYKKILKDFLESLH